MALRPEVNAVAEMVYDEIAPAATRDEEMDWALLHTIHAWTMKMYEIWLIVRDNGTTPGWSVVMNPATAPAAFINWLGIMVGSKPVPGETFEQARTRVGGMSGLRRGSVQALRAAAERSLVETVDHPTKYVIFNERQGGNAYRLAIRTLAEQTPSEVQVATDLAAQKPGGIVMTYDAFEGITWDTLIAAYDTWQDVIDAYSTWAQVLVDLPD